MEFYAHFVFPVVYAQQVDNPLTVNNLRALGFAGEAMPNTNRSVGTQRVINAVGGVSKTAQALGISVAAVSKWAEIPKRHEQALSTLTGKPIAELKQETALDKPGKQRT